MKNPKKKYKICQNPNIRHQHYSDLTLSVSPIRTHPPDLSQSLAPFFLFLHNSRSFVLQISLQRSAKLAKSTHFPPCRRGNDFSFSYFLFLVNMFCHINLTIISTPSPCRFAQQLKLSPFVLLCNKNCSFSSTVK